MAVPHYQPGQNPFIKEYLGKSELAASLGSAKDRLHLAMEFRKAVGWEWDVKSKRISWFGP